MVDTYDPSLPTMRDRIRKALFDKGTPASVPTVSFEITGALEPDVTYDATITLYGEDEAKWRMSVDFLARYGSQPDAVGLDDGTRTAWTTRVAAWKQIIDTWEGWAVIIRRRRQKPIVAQLKTQGVIGPPDNSYVDANDPWFRGSPYPRFPW